MAPIPGFRRLFRFPSSHERVRDEVASEIAFHVDARTEELKSQGMDAAAARAAALREFGSVGEARKELEAIGRRRVRHMQRADWWSDLRQDLRYGVRSLIGAPLFSLLAIATLALGIGANAAVFGVVKSVLLDALPYAEADRLVRVYGRMLDGSVERGPLSAGTIDTIARRQQSFERLAAFAGLPMDAVYGGDDRPRMAKVAWVDVVFFETLGVPAALGRTFRPGDGASGMVPLSGGQIAADPARVVVVTHNTWERLLASDSRVVGRDVRLDGIPRTVIGVLPRGFVGPMGEADFYAALDLSPVLADPIAVRRSQWLGLVARVKPGVSQQAAHGELAAIWADLAREYPADNGSLGIAAMPLRDAMVGDTRTPLLVSMTSAALVLVIASANLAGALLARTLTRRKEFAIRAAIGAGRGRLVRQLLTESTLLAVAGGAAGLLLASFVLAALRGLALPALPAYTDLSLDAGAIALTTLLALATGLAFGTAPALAVGRSQPHSVLRDETRGGGESRRSRRLRGALVAGQIALCLSLLAGAGLLTRSLWAMTTAPLGFDADGVWTASIQLPPRSYPTTETRVRFSEQLVDRLRTLPGVDAVASANSVPTMVRGRVGLTIAGRPWADNREPFVLFAAVSDDYFRILRIPLLQGRAFDSRDAAGPPTAIISESMARRYWPDGAALGARLRLGANVNSPLVDVIGIVGDVRNDPARRDAEPIVYRSSRRIPGPAANVLIRAQGDPLTLMQSVERELAAIDAGLVLERAMTLRAVLGELFTGVQPFDPIAIGLAVALLSGCATMALLVPLRRATRVDPAVSLRAQ